MHAMGYLQTKLSDVIDHNDPAQLKQFHKLATLLFHSEPQSSSQYPSLNSTPLCSSPDLESKLDFRTQNGNLHFHRILFLGSSSSLSQSNNYNHCSSTICCYGKTSPPCSESDESRSYIFDGNCDHKVQRCVLFNRIVKLLPDHLVQPKGNLSDFVRIWSVTLLVAGCNFIRLCWTFLKFVWRTYLTCVWTLNFVS